MSDQIKSQVNEAKNPSGAQSLSPLPAQVEGLATARKDVGDLAKVGSPSPICLSGDHCPDCFNAGYDARDSRTDSNKAKIEALTTLAQMVVDWYEGRTFNGQEARIAIYKAAALALIEPYAADDPVIVEQCRADEAIVAESQPEEIKS